MTLGYLTDTLDNLNEQDIKFGILYLYLLGFDFEKNKSGDLISALKDLKDMANIDNTTIKNLYDNELNETKKALN